MKIKAQFDLITVPTSKTTAIFERNSLRTWFEEDLHDAEQAVALWDGMEIEKPQMRLQRPGGKKHSVTFEATYACNLRCKYCFMADDPEYCANHRHMTFDTAREYLLKQANPKKVEHISAGFLGGEPTMNMDLVCRLVDWCRKNYKRASFNMTTNGTLLAKPLREAVTFNLNPTLGNISIGEWMARQNFGITLSCDGPRAAHDANRVHSDGRGSFDEMWDALQFLCKTPASAWVRRFTWRATYGDDLSVSLLDRLRFFNRAIMGGIGKNVHMEPSTLSTGRMQEVERQHIEATEWYIKAVQAGFSPKWSDMTKVLRLLVERRPKVKNCGAGVNYMSCGADGQIYACHRTFGAEVGNIAGGIDTERAAKWEDNRVYALDDCNHCEARYICSGGCRAANYAENGSVTIPAQTNCFIRRLRLRCALRMLEVLSADELERVCPNLKKA